MCPGRVPGGGPPGPPGGGTARTVPGIRHDLCVRCEAPRER
ncbi:hypothetical protein F750_3137 [Streptomyces sp. PAMC 26508]|nr:hypothetical protein F750_3137 [Streptomyces sp. PAMC 26508]